ncbi:MAG TPA: CRISPR-associated helicase Cas3' [Candidatus Hydrogenedentes bacterium]|nr:CRISPR-associated helicase Cas3' [Candidatus Hydrogenedentota bacterium]
MPSEFFAHVSDGQPIEMHELDEHLRKTATLAANFAEAFGAPDWACLAGLWHDIGKYLPNFQRKLRGESVQVEHSGIGAALALSKGNSGLPLAYAIAGHHGGLPNLDESGEGFPTPLRERIRKNLPRLQEVAAHLPEEIANQALPAVPEQVGKDRKTAEFWTRFLFSTLVDADWLDTEAFFDPQKGTYRGSKVTLRDLRGRLSDYLDCVAGVQGDKDRESPLYSARAAVLQACQDAARRPPGLFSLTAPTGSGKTLSAMAFALNHALAHNLRRVIVVLPFTSIIEQNAEVYRRALGTDEVLEHHANLDPAQREKEYGEETACRHELATENWDTPIIVTTTVQFFESLFSNRRGTCRKVHNIARSVVILDEVQALPPELLLPILDALRELSLHYGCTVVLSTATPPALKKRESLPSGLDGVFEINPDPLELARKLKRVEYRWPRKDEVTGLDTLCEQIAEHLQFLAVVHRRADARELAQMLEERLGDESVFHLSALMCPSHRSHTIWLVRHALKQSRPCRLISTQLIEAGVDIDFPIVFRAMAGLDSIVQAAGRCNREGKRNSGQVVVFRAPTAPPPGIPRKGLEVTEEMLALTGTLDVTDPATFEMYFRSLYFASSLDKRNIQRDREQFNFATVARNFRLIEDGFTRSVVVPYEESWNVIERIRSDGPSCETLRALQPYVVHIYEKAFKDLVSEGALEELCEGVYALSEVFEHLYSEKYGLATGDVQPPSPEKLVF